MPSSRPTPTPQERTKSEIKEYIQPHAQAGKNTVNGAGFDGVELHSASGSFVDQFLQDASNQRTHKYGGSMDARRRFGFEVVDAVVDAVGAYRTGIRVSPWSEYQSEFLLDVPTTPSLLTSGALDMGMKDPIPQFTHFILSLRTTNPEPRTSTPLRPS